jgi:hypothetical protein
MQLITPSLVVSLLALAAKAFPSTPSLLERQGGTGFKGVCILATNMCNVTDPVGATGIMLNCAAGGGFNGQIGEGQHNCTVDGHVSLLHLLRFLVPAAHKTRYGLGKRGVVGMGFAE